MIMTRINQKSKKFYFTRLVIEDIQFLKSNLFSPNMYTEVTNQEWEEKSILSSAI